MTTPPPTGYDVLIRGGLIVDGAGNPGFHGSVGVLGDTVHIVRGDTADIAAQLTIDAAGKVIAPGFIDAHSHSDLALLSDPQLEPKVRQGVTTEIIGVDGLSYAPYRDPAHLEMFVRQNAGIAGLLPEGAAWSSIGDLLAAYDKQCAVNVATLVGNTPLRVNAMGWGDGVASAKALDAMTGMLREAMREGALGLSTGLDYPPGSHASTDELIALAAETARLGGIYHTHVRYSLGDAYLDPFREALDIGRASGIPVHVTHFSRSARSSHPGGAQRMLDLLDRARDDGLDVTFDTYTYEWGGTRLSRLLPEWVQIGGPDAMLERLTDPAILPKVLADVAASDAARAYVTSRPFADLRLGGLTAAEHAGYEGRYLSEVVSELGMDLPRVLCDLVRANPGATFTRPSPHAMTLWKFVCHPLSMIASDSVFVGEYPSPRAYGCFTRVLADFVREERLLSLPDAVRKMTSFPAQRLGLTDRGILRDGSKADVVVFDLDAVAAPASYERPRQLALGMSHVLVNGTPVLLDGELTAATPGRALYGPSSSR